MARVTPKDIADWFLARFGEDEAGLTHLKLQKLVYYAQSWSLALNDCELFEEDFEAWAHGPVVPSLWLTYRKYGWDPLPVPPRGEAPTFDDDTEELLEAVYGAYSEYSAKTLENMTHSEDPWVKARGSLAPEAASSRRIPKSHLKRYYASLLDQ